MKTLRVRIKPYIQPFERKLALAELRALVDAEPLPIDGAVQQAVVFSVPQAIRPEALARQLAYWEMVEGERPYLTTQVLRERTVNVVRNGVPLKEIQQLLFEEVAILPNRRCLRYGTHGLHEYRGKFFPQLVRSLLNVAKVPRKAVVADPMCGSGTTAVETALAEHRALGLDMNPLSVLMANTKCALLSVLPNTLTAEYENIRKQLLRPSTKRPSSLTYFSTLTQEDQTYLRGWFSEQVLFDLDQISTLIQRVSSKPIRDFFRLALSNILRGVSWQKEDDLRVRKEVRLDAEIDPIREFLEEIGRSVRTVLAFLYENRELKVGTFDVQQGDARTQANSWADWTGKVDAIITSPPYATALPYLDTDRLSLCYLGLLPRSAHRKADHSMIGNREITERQRLDYWKQFQEKKAGLPDSVTRLIGTVDTLNSKIDVGFRRRNLPSLLTKYFIDMKQVIQGMIAVLKPGAPAYVVIGNNHTVAGGQRIEIETATLLVDIAASVGMIRENRIPMEMLVSRDIFKRNAVASEEILCFRTPA